MQDALYAAREANTIKVTKNCRKGVNRYEKENRKKNAYQMDCPVAFKYLPDTWRMHGKKGGYRDIPPGYRKICHGSIITAGSGNLEPIHG